MPEKLWGEVAPGPEEFTPALKDLASLLEDRRRSLNQLGRDWVPPELLRFQESFPGVGKHMAEGRVELPGKLEEVLIGLTPMLSATEGEARGRVGFTTERRHFPPSEVFITVDKITFQIPPREEIPPKKKVTEGVPKEGLETAFAQIEKEQAAFKRRWKERIQGIRKGNPEQSHYVLEGLWAARRWLNPQLPKHSTENAALKAWLEERYSPDDLTFFEYLAPTSVLYPSHQDWAKVEDLIGRPCIGQEKVPPPKKMGETMRDNIVGPFLARNWLQGPSSGFWERGASRLESELEKAMTLSIAGQTLLNRQRIEAAMAVKRGDLQEAFGRYFEAVQPERVSYSPDDQTITVTARGGVNQGIDRLNTLLGSVSRYTGIPISLVFSEGVRFAEEEEGEDPLRLYAELPEFAGPMYYEPSLAAGIKRQTRKGEIFQWHDGTTGTGKTTTAANIVEKLNEELALRAKREQKELSPVVVYTLADKAKNLPGVVRAIRKTLQGLMNGENCVLVIDDLHLLEEDTSGQEIHEFQRALTAFNRMLPKLPGKGGVIINSEESPPEDAIKQWHRLEGYTLNPKWTSDSERNRELLDKILGVHDQLLASLDQADLEEVKKIGVKLITATEVEERPHLTGSFLLGQVQNAVTMMEEYPKEEVEEILRYDFESNANAYLRRRAEREAKRRGPVTEEAVREIIREELVRGNLV